MIINTGLPLAGGVRFSSGSYVGTGTTDSGNPTSVDVGFEPKAFFVCQAIQNGAAGNTGDFAFWISGAGHLKSPVSNQNFLRPVQVTGTKISWYVSSMTSYAATNQFNVSGSTYVWFALG